MLLNLLALMLLAIPLPLLVAMIFRWVLGIPGMKRRQEEQLEMLKAIHRLMDYELRNRRGVQKVA